MRRGSVMPSSDEEPREVLPVANLVARVVEMQPAARASRRGRRAATPADPHEPWNPRAVGFTTAYPRCARRLGPSCGGAVVEAAILAAESRGTR